MPWHGASAAAAPWMNAPAAAASNARGTRGHERRDRSRQARRRCRRSPAGDRRASTRGPAPPGSATTVVGPFEQHDGAEPRREVAHGRESIRARIAPTERGELAFVRGQHRRVARPRSDLGGVRAERRQPVAVDDHRRSDAKRRDRAPSPTMSSSRPRPGPTTTAPKRFTSRSSRRRSRPIGTRTTSVGAARVVAVTRGGQAHIARPRAHRRSRREVRGARHARRARRSTHTALRHLCVSTARVRPASARRPIPRPRGHGRARRRGRCRRSRMSPQCDAARLEQQARLERGERDGAIGASGAGHVPRRSGRRHRSGRRRRARGAPAGAAGAS